MRLSSASSWITPTKCFYVFNHSEVFNIEGHSWTINVSGEVDRTLTLTFSDLLGFQQTRITNTIECAGNGRAFFKPSVPGVQWKSGAVGTAVFQGPHLADVLAAARIRRTAKHIVFTGADSLLPSRQQFTRSIPLEKALNPNTILAILMNGRPLSPRHGFPLRLIVPGWIGAASVKRVIAITASRHEAESEYMQENYRLAMNDSSGPTTSFAITSLRVKSTILHPLNGSISPHYPLIIRGLAWAGEADIAKVEVSTNVGTTWHPAHLEQPYAKYAWRFWSYP